MDADKKRLWVSGQFVEVTDEIYDAYMKGDRKMRYFESDLKAERFLMDENGQIKQVIPSREDSLDRLMDDNAEQFADHTRVLRTWCYAGFLLSGCIKRLIHSRKGKES